MIRSHAPGTIVIEFNSGLLLQILLFVEKQINGEQITRMYFTRPRPTLSNALIKPADPTELDSIYDVMRAAEIHYIDFPIRSGIDFFHYSLIVLVGELGVAEMGFTISSEEVRMHKCLLSQDYINYDYAPTKYRRFVTMYFVKRIDPLRKQVMRDQEDTHDHFKLYQAVRVIMLSDNYNSFLKWINSD